LHNHLKTTGLIELEESSITSVDKKFLQTVYDLINKNISNSNFNVEALSRNIGMSRAVLHKKLISLIGESPVELIRRIRLTKSAELIEKKFGNLSEIALEVGFNNPAYFSECFKKQFGVSPSQYPSKSNKI
jgi:AraC-like DNA-binding protein